MGVFFLTLVVTACTVFLTREVRNAAAQEQIDCPARDAPNVRSFDDSDPKLLVGRYDLTMASLWENERGLRAGGQMELWLTDSLRCCYVPEYLRLPDSVVGSERYSQYDTDSIVRWRPKHVQRLTIWGTTDINLQSMTIPIDLDRLSSNDPDEPGLEWIEGGWIESGRGLELAPVDVEDGGMAWLEVDSLSDGGFWGEWKSDLGRIHIVDRETGRTIPNAHGLFCAVRKEVDSTN